MGELNALSIAIMISDTESPNSAVGESMNNIPIITSYLHLTM